MHWHNEHEGEAFTKLLSQISSQCYLNMGCRENRKPTRPHPSKWQQLKISVTWLFLKMEQDCFFFTHLCWLNFLSNSYGPIPNTWYSHLLIVSLCFSSTIWALIVSLLGPVRCQLLNIPHKPGWFGLINEVEWFFYC